MLSNEFFTKWFAAFAALVEKHTMDNNVLAPGNMPWHIFTWGAVPCLEGQKAIDEFFKLETSQKILLFKGFDYQNEPVEQIDYIDKPAIKLLMRYGNEVYITSADFTWSFVWTHESDIGCEYCGPFFCYRKNAL